MNSPSWNVFISLDSFLNVRVVFKTLGVACREAVTIYLCVGGCYKHFYLFIFSFFFVWNLQYRIFCGLLCKDFTVLQDCDGSFSAFSDNNLIVLAFWKGWRFPGCDVHFVFNYCYYFPYSQYLYFLSFYFRFGEICLNFSVSKTLMMLLDPYHLILVVSLSFKIIGIGVFHADTSDVWKLRFAAKSNKLNGISCVW